MAVKDDDNGRTPPAYIEQLRLDQFKSFAGTTIPFAELTLFIGRNASGKSNALDGLVVLSRLASGDDLRDALDGSRLDAEPVRGGAEGCAPFGRDDFTLGCRVRSGLQAYDFEVSIMVRPDVKIIHERLTAVQGVAFGGRDLTGRDLLATESPEAERMDIRARYFNGKRGADPSIHFSANRLLLGQVPTRLPGGRSASDLVQRAALSVQSALQAVFVLDPVPHLMRQYVNRRDSELRRNAENLSAAVLALRERSQADFGLLEELLRAMPERPFVRIGSASSDLGDVILTVDEGDGSRSVRVSARQMSDGMLRFLAFGTALLSAPLLDSSGGRIDEPGGQRTLVIEEVENGLHPTMAAQVVDLVKSQSRRRQIRTVVTTHSPALLNALKGDDHPGVIVFDRDDTGRSRARRLVDLPGYAELMAAGGLGTAVSIGGLSDAARPRDPISDEFASFLAGL